MVSLVMTTFGLGAGLPLAALGLLSRQGFLRSRGALGSMAKIGKMLMGGFLILMGTFILLGLDKAIEAYLVKASPDWLINLTTYF